MAQLKTNAFGKSKVNAGSTQHNSFRNFRNLKMQVLATIYIIIRIIKNKVCRCGRPKCEYCHGSSSSGGVCAVFTRHDNILSGCPMLRVRLLFIMSILSPVNKYYHTRHSVNKYVTIQYLVYYIIAETICLHSSPVQRHDIHYEYTFNF